MVLIIYEVLERGKCSMCAFGAAATYDPKEPFDDGDRSPVVVTNALGGRVNFCLSCLQVYLTTWAEMNEEDQ